jgi:signal transduction histidine kinase/integral membrane sensor domain MASE1
VSPHFFDSARNAKRPVALSRYELTLAAVGVAVAYYVGAQVGLALTFPPATTSVLWPPNAILTSALLMVPTRHWWVCFGAAFPVHVALEVGAGYSPALVVLLFLTNCSEAAIAAGGLRIVRPGAVRFDSLGRVAAFIAAVGVAAPILSSCLDAAVVSLLRDEHYWTVWRTRVFANTLTEICVVPALLLGGASLATPRWPTRRRVFEAVSLFVSLAVVATGVFGEFWFSDAAPGIPRTPTVLLLPLLFWAAVRFGVGGVSAALLLTALVASVAATRGHRPFSMLTPLESLMAVQLYLSVMSVPLMCLAGLLEERRQAAAALSERLRFEGLLAQISASFVSPAERTLQSVYDQCLARVGQFLHADAVFMDTGRTERSHDRFRQWRRTEQGEQLLSRSAFYFHWVQARLDASQIMAFTSLDELPAEAFPDRETFRALGLQSAVVVPVATRGSSSGALVVANQAPRVWRELDVNQVRLIAELLSNAWMRDESEVELQRARRELARVARSVTMGELMSSLAHQLNQPLTGILSNAQTACRLLDDDGLHSIELREIVEDIIDDNRRATEVIKRMREMLARSSTPAETLDINGVVRDVAVLVTSETIIRNVSITLRLTAEPVCVVGARVELQQAVLNVLSSAMDAVAEREVEMRLVDVSVEQDGQSNESPRTGVRVVVRNAGNVVSPRDRMRLVEPASDIVEDGSIALAVARAIVENHGGMITAESDPRGGAVVTISLPHASRSAA